MHYNRVLKSLQNNQNNFVTEFKSHISLTINWTIQYSKVIYSIVENQNKIMILIKKMARPPEIMT